MRDAGVGIGRVWNGSYLRDGYAIWGGGKWPGYIEGGVMGPEEDEAEDGESMYDKPVFAEDSGV
jgi:hypothetical protein